MHLEAFRLSFCLLSLSELEQVVGNETTLKLKVWNAF